MAFQSTSQLDGGEKRKSFKQWKLYRFFRARPLICLSNFSFFPLARSLTFLYLTLNDLFRNIHNNIPSLSQFSFHMTQILKSRHRFWLWCELSVAERFFPSSKHFVIVDSVMAEQHTGPSNYYIARNIFLAHYHHHHVKNSINFLVFRISNSGANTAFMYKESNTIYISFMRNFFFILCWLTRVERLWYLLDLFLTKTSLKI
jgi:hypothetical protein